MVSDETELLSVPNERQLLVALPLPMQPRTAV